MFWTNSAIGVQDDGDHVRDRALSCAILGPDMNLPTPQKTSLFKTPQKQKAILGKTVYRRMRDNDQFQRRLLASCAEVLRDVTRLTTSTGPR